MSRPRKYPIVKNDNGGESFYQRLERLLKDKGIAKATIAQASGISSNGMITWAATGVLPRADTAITMARMLGVSVEYLILGELPGIDTQNDTAYRVATLTGNKQKIIDAVAGALEEMDF